MDINLVEILVQGGALGLTFLLLIGLWKYGGAFVTRLMDNLQLQAENHEATIRVQAEVANTLAMLCRQLDTCEDEHEKRIQETAQAHAQMVKAIDDLRANLQGHENRAQKRHDQQMRQAEERHAELINVLQGMNGK